ncbi:hypothetical protein BCV71DRAFT_175496 [Rhizopus microsporus]|uniref:Uncharacterized protein n=1 Tax=Rhizopus microsporus TaxID=58291 RepID=A0A1X0S8C8_RHIZD|nr:hypothetical protein BCV71DRAFT_175496 [Rhizopus microsporus]
MIFPQPMPHPAMDRNNSMMPHPIPWPPLGPNFPGSPSNGNFAHHPPMPMMGLPMFNPVMHGPPPPLWNFISPGHDAWPGPSPPSSQPNQEVKNEEEALQAKPESAIAPPAPEPRSMQPPVVPEPMIRRGLSFISGLFGNGAGQLKKAQEYEKLGTFWCWRILPPQNQEGTAQMPAQFHFESFSIANQKLINRKISKGQTSTIFLGREKKLPGVIMIDVNQCRGCCMIKDGHFLQLELKREQYNGNGEGNRYVFHNSSAPGGW